MVKNSPKIRFKKGLSIGNSAAEEDKIFLENCFLQTEDLNLLKDVTNPKSVVLGRTGAGKSALLMKLEGVKKNVIRVDPNNLSLNYIANSNVINFLTSLGVDLDIFYQMLWRHVFCVELIKNHFSLTSESRMPVFDNWLLSIVNPKKKIAVEYLKKWERTFWLETESRIKEIVTIFEENFKVKSDIDISGIGLSSEAQSSLDQTLRSDIINRAKKVVDDSQIKDLGEVIRLLGEEVFNDTQKAQYIVIDDLDLNWVDDLIRYKLIRSLIETIKTFRNIAAVKILIAMRSDLLEGVYKRTLSPGFQPEKYKDLEMQVTWTDEQLKGLVDARIEYLFEREYTKQKVLFDEVFPEKVNNKQTFSYLVERTLKRPRDIIKFINFIFEEAQGKAEITQKIILDAESLYSDDRRQSLVYEWMTEHPMLGNLIQFLENKSSRLFLSSFSAADIDHLVLTLIEQDTNLNDPITKSCEKFYNGKMSLEDFVVECIKCLYKVGAVGVRLNKVDKTLFSSNGPATLPISRFNEETRIDIHPMLWRSLGVYKLRKGVFIDTDDELNVA